MYVCIYVYMYICMYIYVCMNGDMLMSVTVMFTADSN